MVKQKSYSALSLYRGSCFAPSVHRGFSVFNAHILSFPISLSLHIICLYVTLLIYIFYLHVLKRLFFNVLMIPYAFIGLNIHLLALYIHKNMPVFKKWEGWHCFQGFHGQGKVREKQKFSRSGKSQGILQKVRENLSSCQSQWKVREIFFRLAQGFVKIMKTFSWRIFFWRILKKFLKETEANVKKDLPVAYLASRLMQGQWKLFWG